MRFHVVHALAIAVMLSNATTARADAASDTRRLYDTITTAVLAMADLLEDFDDPRSTADALVEQVNKPLADAIQAWMDKALEQGDSGERHRPFLSCYEAAWALKFYHLEFVRYFRGLEKTPPKPEGVEPFEADLGRCEEALGLEKTFS